MQQSRYIFDDFKKVFTNRRFLGLSIALPLVGMPLMLWIALSPIILVDELKLSSVQYGLAQFPVFFGLIAGNIILIKIIDRFPLGKTILMGLPIMLIAVLAISFCWCYLTGEWQHDQKKVIKIKKLG